MTLHCIANYSAKARCCSPELGESPVQFGLGANGIETGLTWREDNYANLRSQILPPLFFKNTGYSCSRMLRKFLTK